jgi:putative membrane protein
MIRNLIRKCYLALVVCFVVLCVVFAIANRKPTLVSLHPLPWEIEIPLFLFAMLCLIVGFLWGSMQGVFSRLRAHQLHRKEHHRITALETELAALKAERSNTAGTATTPLARPSSADESASLPAHYDFS